MQKKSTRMCTSCSKLAAEAIRRAGDLLIRTSLFASRVDSQQILICIIRDGTEAISHLTSHRVVRQSLPESRPLPPESLSTCQPVWEMNRFESAQTTMILKRADIARFTASCNNFLPKSRLSLPRKPLHTPAYAHSQGCFCFPYRRWPWTWRT